MQGKTISLLIVLISLLIFHCGISGGRSSGGRLSDELCTKLWSSDRNRFVEDRDYKLRLQGNTTSKEKDDKAPRNLFRWVRWSKLIKNPTVLRLIYTFDNYALYTGETEVVTRKERKENSCFLNNILRTKPIEIAHQYLAKERLVPATKAGFKTKLRQLWFDLYERRAANDSSGYEHVFVGEIMRKGASRLVVGGLHNWVNYYYHEKHRTVDYKGFITYKQKEPKGVTVRFSFHDVAKPIGGFFVGTSPEFEMALYTICFLKFPNAECGCRINGESFKIRSYQVRGAPQHVATAYPVFD